MIKLKYYFVKLILIVKTIIIILTKSKYFPYFVCLFLWLLVKNLEKNYSVRQ
jgi:F0F1-type ATP synthase membrane subunit a